MNEKTGLRDKLSLLWKALLLSFRMKSKVSICISVIGMLLGLFTLWSNILNADLINRITGLIQGEDVLRQALFTLLCIVLIEVLLLVYNMLKSYFVQYDSMRADEYIHDTTYDILSRTKYENIENNSNFMQKLDFMVEDRTADRLCSEHRLSRHLPGGHIRDTVLHQPAYCAYPFPVVPAGALDIKEIRQ